MSLSIQLINVKFDKTKKIVEKPSYVESPVSRRPKIKKDGILDQSQKWQEIAAIHSKILGTSSSINCLPILTARVSKTKLLRLYVVFSS